MKFSKFIVTNEVFKIIIKEKVMSTTSWIKNDSNKEDLVTKKIKDKVTYITYHKNSKGKYPLWEDIKNKYKRRK
jgi:hypothetical protein|tara:strand:- start:46 stop:267 length:222 start_codon:yes stop_codon:yes gene_type:complete